MSFWKIRANKSARPSQYETPLALAEAEGAAFSEKANHNKHETNILLFVSIVAPLLAPVFITLGTEWVSAKLVPSLLAASATFSTAWFQIRQPQKLWGLYRTAQRRVENEAIQYNFGTGPYKDEQTRDQNLIAKLDEIASQTNDSWVGLIPKAGRAERLVQGRETKGAANE